MRTNLTVFGCFIYKKFRLHCIFTNWGKDIVGLTAQKQLTVDGKQLRGIVETDHKQATVQIVSVWSEKERGMCGVKSMAERQRPT